MQEAMRQSDFASSTYEVDRELSAKFPGQANSTPPSQKEFASSLQINKVINDSGNISIAQGLEVRAIVSPGHTAESLAFQILPKEHLIVDEGFGYFRGKDLSAPGGDLDQDKAIESIKKVAKIEVSSLCLPNTGYLTGQLIRKHLHSIPQNTEDLFLECAKAHSAGMSDDEIRASVFDSFYRTEDQDPVLQASLLASFEAIWRQVLTLRQAH
jgi:hypothetical protein